MQKEAMLYEKLPGESVHCFFCAHHCRIRDQEFGFCGVRQIFIRPCIRQGRLVQLAGVGTKGQCPACGNQIPGIWT